MKQAALSFIIFLSIGSMCSTCVSCGPDGPTYFLDEEITEYVVFKNGSYWVYEEINSNQVDSLKLFSAEVFIQNGQSRFGFNFQKYTELTTSTLSGDTLSGLAVLDFSKKNFSVFTRGSTNINRIFDRPVLFFSNQPTGYIFNPNEDDLVEYVEFLDSYTVLGTEYLDIMVFEHKKNYFLDQPKKIYYARGIGIIKKELFNGKVWQLKTSSVIK